MTQCVIMRSPETHARCGRRPLQAFQDEFPIYQGLVPGEVKSSPLLDIIKNEYVLVTEIQETNFIADANRIGIYLRIKPAHQ